MPRIPPTSQSENSVAVPLAMRAGGEGGRGASGPGPVMSRARVARVVSPAPTLALVFADDAERTDDVERAVWGGEGGTRRPLRRNTASGAPASAKHGEDGRGRGDTSRGGAWAAGVECTSESGGRGSAASKALPPS